MRTDRSFSTSVALLAAGALFLEILDGTILVTAVPSIAADLGVRAVDVSVALVTYLVAAAACIPAAGWLTDRFGVRRTLLGAIAGFTLASVGCALAPNLATLTVARGIQGVAGSLIVPAGRLAVVRGTDPKDLLDAIAFLTWPALVAPVVAPALGGLLSDTVGWRSIFLINIPLGLAAFIAALLVLPRNTERPPGRFDGPGFLGAMVVMAAVTGSAEMLSQGSATSATLTAGVLVVGLVIGYITVRWLQRPGKLFSLEIFSDPAFRVGNVSGSVYRLVITAAPFMFTLLFQVRFGWSASAAGMAVVALFVGNVGIKPFTTPIIRRLGFRHVLLWSSVLGGLLLLAFVPVTATTPLPVILVLLFLSGVFRSLGYSAYNTLQFVDVPEDGVANANILSATLHQLATSLGIAVAVVLIQAASAVADGVAGEPDLGYQWSFVPAAALFLFPLAGAVGLARDVGARALATSPEIEPEPGPDPVSTPDGADPSHHHRTTVSEKES